MKRFILWLYKLTKSKPGDWMDKPAAGGARSATANANAYDPDEELNEFSKPVLNPVLAAMESVKEGKATIREAYLFEGRFNEDGKLLREAKGSKPYRLKRYSGDGVIKAKIAESETKFRLLPNKASNARFLKEAQKQKLKRAKEAGLIEGFDDFDETLTQFDVNQYTEYTPLYGGPHFKQLYLYDYLLMHARAFEQWNHQPLAKRIINILSQYTLGRGFKVVGKDDAMQKVWDEFDQEHSITKKMRKFWVREYLLYGELMIDKNSWQSIDPSTVWDIVTDPDNIEDVYYYHQQYSTAYFQFTGQKVPGVAGSDKTAPIEFIIRQLPYDQVIHIKTECVSNEKRGRSVLFPVLGWIKRLKDFYNAQVVKAQLESAFIWDDTIKGSDSDITAHAARYSSMPAPGSVFAHNEAVERKPMQAMTSTRAGASGVAEEILSLIATSVGIPKEHLNVTNSGGGSRAMALVGSEPFTKVIEDFQGDFESLLHTIMKAVCEQQGAKYEEDSFEFIFPSVTKDTTSEVVTNLGNGVSMGFISTRTAGNIYAGEMNITTYDYDTEQKDIKEDQAKDLEMAAASLPTGRFGQPKPKPGQEEDPGGNDIHGEQKLNLQDQLKSL